MAGIIVNSASLSSQYREFIVGQNLKPYVNSKIVTLQVSDDELDAVLWGIANYNHKDHPTFRQTERNHNGADEAGHHPEEVLRVEGRPDHR